MPVLICLSILVIVSMRVCTPSSNLTSIHILVAYFSFSVIDVQNVVYMYSHYKDELQLLKHVTYCLI